MPFQSEKQRRYMHANLPKIAKRWERDYAHGGILDINESEEIIDDGGNEIELTDYNAAFDDPNDLSTGVKSLFRAKDGGTPQLAKKSKDGKRPGYGGPHETYGGGVEAGRSSGPSDRGPRDAPDRFGPVAPPSKSQTVPEGINIHTDTGKEEEAYVIVGGQKVPQSIWGTSADPREKYDTEKQMLDDTYAFNIPGATKKHTYITGKTAAALKRAEDALKAKLKKTGKSRLLKAITMLVLGFPIDSIPSTLIGKGDLKTVIQYSIPIMKAKQAHKTALQNAKADYEELGMAKFHHAVDTPLQDIEQQLLDLTQTRDEDDKGDGSPELPKVVPIGEEIEEYTQYGMSDLDRIRAGQAKRAMLVQRGIIQDNPIVDESVTDITMQANSGGLANLFRVKNQ